MKFEGMCAKTFGLQACRRSTCHRRVDDALNSMCRIALVLQSKCKGLLSGRPWGCSTGKRRRRGDIPVSTDQLSSGSA